jgi:hypothetical protein
MQGMTGRGIATIFNRFAISVSIVIDPIRVVRMHWLNGFRLILISGSLTLNLIINGSRLGSRSSRHRITF